MNVVKDKRDYSHIITLIKKNDQRKLKDELPKLIDHIASSLMKKVNGYGFNEIRDIVVAKYVDIHESIINDQLEHTKTLLSYYYLASLREVYHNTKIQNRDLHIDGLSDEETYFFKNMQVDPPDFDDGYDYLYNAINNLRKEYKDIVYLYLRYPDIQSKDVGNLLDMTDGKVRLYKYRAFKELKRKLSMDNIRIPSSAIKVKPKRTLTNVIMDLRELEHSYNEGKISGKKYQSAYDSLIEEISTFEIG